MITPFVAVLCLGLQGQTQKPKWKAIDLPTTTRPFVEIEPFKKIAFTRVQQVETWPPGGGASSLRRYYFFTYKVDYDTEAKRWETLFPKSKGWTYQSLVGNDLMISQVVDHPKISDHMLMLGPGTTKPSPSDPKLPMIVMDPAWVRVTLGETLKRVGN